MRDFKGYNLPMPEDPLDLDAIEARATAEHYVANVLSDDIFALVAALREARAEVKRMALVITSLTAMVEAKSSWIDGARIDIDGLEAERDGWRRRYETLRDGVTGLHREGSEYVEPNGGATFTTCCGCDDDWPCETARVVARVEGDES